MNACFSRSWKNSWRRCTSITAPDSCEVRGDINDSSTPFVSFIILTKNSAKRIGKCLESLVEMDYPKDRYEIIVVDGMSTDDTVTIARRYGAKVVLCKINGLSLLGVKQGAYSKSRNAGLSVAKGEFVAFVDDDAWLSPEWLRELMDGAFLSPDIVGAVGLSFTPPPTSRIGRYIGVLPLSLPSGDELAPLPFVQPDYTTRRVSDGFDVDFVWGDYLVTAKQCVYRKSALEKANGFDENLFCNDDNDMAARLLKMGFKLTFVPTAKAWHQPRQSLHAFAKQQLRYGLAAIHQYWKHPEASRLKWFLAPSCIMSLLVLGILSFVSDWSLYAFLSLLCIGFLTLFSYGLRAAMRYGHADMIVGVPSICIAWLVTFSIGLLWGAVFSREFKKSLRCEV